MQEFLNPKSMITSGIGGKIDADLQTRGSDPAIVRRVIPGFVMVAAVSLAIGACSTEPQLESKGRGQAALVCGLPSVDAPASRPVDACRDGDFAMPLQRFERHHGSPAPETVAFVTASSGNACATMRSGSDDGHHVASAHIDLDGATLAGPSAFDQQTRLVEKRFVLPAGPHILEARLAGNPGSWVEVAVRTGGDGVQHSLATAGNLELYNLFADPAVFRGASVPTRLTVYGTVARLPGSGSYVVRWKFEIRSVASCALVRTLSGESLVDTTASFRADATWNGLDDAGAEAPDGDYAYRAVAQLVRRIGHQEEVVATVATPQQIATLEPMHGYVDFHTHPMSYLGFGGKAVHGAPDVGLIVPKDAHGCASEIRAATIDDALGSCNATHGGWGADNLCGDYLRAAIVNFGMDGAFHEKFGTSNVHGDHEHAGAPNFSSWPHQTSILHQQMWWEWLKRAHDGGLSVIVALAVNNELLAELLNATPPYDDRSVADRQIAETKRMVANRSEWMEIALSSEDLRRIVGAGKLAVVLGMEVDRIGNFGALSLPSESGVRDELRRLYGLGIRYVFPIHLVDNAFGGSAVYEAMFTFANKRANGYPFIVETSTDPLVTFSYAHLGDLPLFGVHNAALAWINSTLTVLGELPFPCFDLVRCPLPPGQVKCCSSYQTITEILSPSVEWDVYATTFPGHVNIHGLSSAGAIAIDEMMKLGMFIDLDHMSEKAMERVIEISEESVPITQTGYPLMFGHTAVRAPTDGHFPAKASERHPPALLMARVKALGGMAGAGTADASPEEFIHNYRELRDILGAGNVALGTDVDGLEPLPKTDGCDTAGSTAFYDRFLRESGLTTKSSTKSPTGERTWDYKLDCGVSHYGLMPEFLFEVKMKTVDDADDVHAEIMTSTRHFYEMWQRLEAASARLKAGP